MKSGRRKSKHLMSPSLQKKPVSLAVLWGRPFLMSLLPIAQALWGRWLHLSKHWGFGFASNPHLSELWNITLIRQLVLKSSPGLLVLLSPQIMWERALPDYVDVLRQGVLNHLELYVQAQGKYRQFCVSIKGALSLCGVGWGWKLPQQISILFTKSRSSVFCNLLQW